jgi:hypothetical protein
MAGEEGFEPPILGPEPSALPLGHSPIKKLLADSRELIAIQTEVIISNKILNCKLCYR